MKKALKIIGWSLFSLLLIAYMAGTAYSRLRFWPGTTINGVDVGTMDAAQAEQALNRTAPYLTVVQKNAETLEKAFLVRRFSSPRLPRSETIVSFALDRSVHRLVRDALARYVCKCFSLRSPSPLR